MGTLRLGSPLLILLLGGYQVRNGPVTLGTMLALNALVGTALQLQLVRSYLERIDGVLSTAPAQAKGTGVQAAKLQGGIALDRVSLRYGPLAPPAVQDVSLRILPGQFVVIVGRSGAGKSTLASLLLGLYTPTCGRILFDGADLTQIDVRLVRRQVGIVPQHSYRFGASVRENITQTDPTLPLEAVVQAAHLAQIHTEIMAMPMGYETLLADGSVSLSGGQRQRVALVRALVHQPAIRLL
jgi:ATP-binding cassette, subfamily B, bacterial